MDIFEEMYGCNECENGFSLSPPEFHLPPPPVPPSLANFVECYLNDEGQSILDMDMCPSIRILDENFSSGTKTEGIILTLVSAILLFLVIASTLIYTRRLMKRANEECHLQESNDVEKRLWNQLDVTEKSQKVDENKIFIQKTYIPPALFQQPQPQQQQRYDSWLRNYPAQRIHNDIRDYAKYHHYMQISNGSDSIKAYEIIPTEYNQIYCNKCLGCNGLINPNRLYYPTRTFTQQIPQIPINNSSHFIPIRKVQQQISSSSSSSGCSCSYDSSSGYEDMASNQQKLYSTGTEYDYVASRNIHVDRRYIQRCSKCSCSGSSGFRNSFSSEDRNNIPKQNVNSQDYMEIV